MVDRRSLAVALCNLFLLFHCTFQQSSQPLSSFAEKITLLQLRSTLGLRSRDWPIKGDPCLKWVGIQCQNGSVIGINISGFKRTRIGSQNPQFSVDALANLTLLESFNASRFLLPGSIPDWFGNELTALQVLDLRFCSISGAIPFSLGNLSNVGSLFLAGNDLTGVVPASLGQLSRLSVLDLSRNSLIGSIPPSFASLGNLTSLDMSSNFLSGIVPADFGALSKLQFLNLSNNSLSSSIPAQLGNLSSLVDLDLSLNAFSGSVPPDLGGLGNLQKMVFGYNLLAGSLPGNLFPNLTQLQFIVLNNNSFTGDLPDVLWSIPALLYLDASNNNFSGMLPNTSGGFGVNATVLNLSHNMFYGDLAPVISRFSFIDITSNYFEGRVPNYIGSNASLDGNCLTNLSSQRNGTECASFYSDRGLVFDNFGLPNGTQPPPSVSAKKSHRYWIILAGVLGGVLFIALLVGLVVLIVYCHNRGARNQRGTTGVVAVPAGGSPQPPGLALNFSSLGDGFTYQQLLLATDNFNDVNLIKHGHSGDLFRGILDGGVPVVIKKVDLQAVKKETYMSELDFFSKVSHARLVPLLGHCLENENEKFLVYKYMPNGDLSSSLYRKTSSEDESLQSLDWITRLKIATGAAEGLSYLHHECSPPHVHRDVQASSILLDDKFEVRLGSLSEVCVQEGDAHQSMITRLLRLPTTSDQGTSGLPTSNCAYDVYCFGKVLLELVTGKLGMSASSESEMKDWLESTLPYISIYDKELVTNIVDPSLIIDEDLLEEVWAMAIVARSCLNPKPTRRPLMRYILKALENPLKVVREEHSSSARLRATSSRGSWNAALFGSWRHSLSDAAAVPAASGSKAEVGGSFKQSATSASQGSGQNGSSSTRRHSNEIFPEPSNAQDLERPNEGLRGD
ncbi:probable LRR receptor-like serine/threonine-protein kinase At2g16250 [Rhododendron vialii]|uniref:probable LRR receptor-like serine/threonine-protein kinase At2g16250 n=1 Tax=Rhododendron vialii TaxID=182163 RepID=UPI00265EA276|nr:probable LRR receptor-like serine/threonine-protein kinase At2g16250 [Rhododendron vialii]